ncbi:alanine racemase [Noviherbaspirillum sedimenti]|uniref:Alanine racemase n=1 Tax=Noviherbaspirillum sedimenti TaxID=2320865 RepID=A0A3A3FY57_9BURK|nr:alanine racemase [Noviherbaspirillum sedimenti]RJG01123.1 alanine racemase [Noviherbaspirillum sedimenti]
MPRPLLATIDISALRHNLAVARRCAPQSKIWAVVKANAYGHGLARGMRGFADADGLALIEVEGAVQLRELGWQKPILLLEGVFELADMQVVAQHQLDIAIHCDEQIRMLEQAGLPGPVDVHLKLNSGMNRLGFRPEAFRDAYARLRAIAAVRQIGMITHFANAEEAGNPGMPLAEQLARFQRATEGLVGPRSLSNSAGILLHPQVQGQADWIRPGIMLYGATPGARSAQGFDLQPAMHLTSRIIGMQHIEAGETVGYGSRFAATGPMTVGVVACGYADGYPRHAPSGTPVLVDGVRTRLLGTVSMDMLSVDLTDVPGAGIGSAVTLWGAGLPIDEVANAAGTVGYELMCALAPRVRVVEN